MDKQLVEVEMVVCDICRKEVPVSEAKIPEAVDYVAHFCGLECYAKWQEESGGAKH
ncbi:DUF3330 domain-containing protein [Gallionella capsiferriformans]|jgi:hypothetical protein|uniref:DUF3330 domain-containing protein n=1 Tax=Gallionella capsiferriformans (strain ES-2) TaxID=395494 RepID=D9SI18_GALCS|nr:DUF3330 domain-containing protein [Gallionella capsiferriformans]ADL56108.1 Protein of unknown function DUF3330 [Gallionella capsiferriformans ES-2]